MAYVPDSTYNDQGTVRIIGTRTESSVYIGSNEFNRVVTDPVNFAPGVTVLYDARGISDTLEIKSSGQQIVEVTFDAFNGNQTLHFANGSSFISVGVERFVLNGSDANDVLAGGSGKDWLNGGKGADTYYETAGNDGYVFDDAGDRVIDTLGRGSGHDVVWASASVDLRVQGTMVEELVLENRGFTIGDPAYAINGTGNDLDNIIRGNSHTNVLTGGVGNDKLFGNGGADTFVFNEMGARNRDYIVDFGSDDHIRLDKAVFMGLTDTNGVLNAGDFVIGTKATADHGQLIYDPSTGVLSYDADGTGAGAAEDIALIGKKLGFVDHTDFLIA